MPKQKTDDLIQLIRSLSRAEKRHFRLFVKRNQASDEILFLQLFDFLEKRGEYDEDMILRKLQGIKKRQLSNLKAHLYKQLLISLRLLSAKNVEDIQLREQVDHARVLYDKGLYRQSLDILAKAKQKAEAGNFHALILEILDFEKHIEGQYITRSIKGRAEELAQETQLLNRVITGSSVYSNLSLQLYGWYLKRGYVRNEADVAELNAFFQANRPDFPYEALDFTGQIHFCQSHVWYYYTIQDFVYCYRYAQKWVNLFREQDSMIPLHAPLYLKGLHTLLNALFLTRQYDKFEYNYQLLLDFPRQMGNLMTQNTEGLYALYKYLHQIKLHFMKGTFSKGVEMVPELMNQIKADTYSWDDHRIMTFYYRIACLYFGSGDNNRAITYLNMIINQKNPNYRADIQCFARILNLIAHFELGNAQLVEYQVKSVYRFLAKMGDLGAVQKEIFRFLRRTPRIEPSEVREAFQELKLKLKEVSRDPFEQRPFLYLDIISWLESKIEGVSVQDIIHQKYLERNGVEN